MLNKLRSPQGVRIHLLVLTAVLGLAPAAAQAFPDGETTGGTTCGGCHGSSATGTVGVSISGPSSLNPNESATYTFTIDQGNAGGAFNIATNGGSLAVVDANTQLVSGQLTHLNALVAAPAGNIGDWVYDFTVTAPSVMGSILLSAVGMQFTGDGGNGGDDVWNTTTFGINVVPEPATALLLGTGLIGLALHGRRRREMR